MEIDIKHACSFTGHRPERLEISQEKAISWLEEQIRKASGTQSSTALK